MQKFVPYLSALFFVACIAACGGGAFTPATQVYGHPAGPAPANPLGHMGGAVQGGPITAKFSSYSVSTFAGTVGNAGFNSYSTAYIPPANFNHPTDITTDGTNLFVADYLNNAIRQIVISTGAVTTLQFTDAAGAAISFNQPHGITTSADGKTLYVVDSGSNTIRFIDLDTKKVTTIIGSTTGVAGSVDSTVPTEVRFNQPTGITTDGVNLYVTDFNNDTVRRIDLGTKAVSTMAGASGAIGSADGAQDAARFNKPTRITTDGTNLDLTDVFNRTIRQIVIENGNVTTIAGAPGPLGHDAGSIDGSGAVARFNQPNGITTDGKYLYVTDSYQNTIRRIVISTGEVTTIAGIPKTAEDASIGVGGSVDSPGPGTPSFYTPIGITTDGTSLFVADTFNNTIRKIH